LKESDEILSHTFNLIIGTNLLSLKVGKEKAESLGYDCKVVTSSLKGDVNDVATFITDEIKAAREGIPNHRKCLLFAGEPTVKVTGDGLGGRNQHLALIIAKSLKNLSDVVFLSGGTDGNDGPTDAAGAVVDSNTYWKATELHLDVESFIKNHDSYNFFRQEGGLIVTGPTKTNVMDLMVALVN
jgi:glycerate-2-kinase